MSHTFSKLMFHCTFSTKERRSFLTPEIGSRLDRYMAGIARQKGMHLLRAGGVADHRHLLLELKPAKSVSDAMRDIKASSSGWLRKSYPDLHTFSWQEGFGAFSVSVSARDDVIAYIDRQEQHHHRMTFEEELKTLLDKHGIEYDPKHILD